MHGILPKVVEITIQCKQQLRTPFCHMLCLGMHSNMMLRFMVQALQDPPLCSSTFFNLFPCIFLTILDSWSLIEGIRNGMKIHIEFFLVGLKPFTW